MGLVRSIGRRPKQSESRPITWPQLGGGRRIRLGTKGTWRGATARTLLHIWSRSYLASRLSMCNS
jgi:hypothetical protein